MCLEKNSNNFYGKIKKSYMYPVIFFYRDFVGPICTATAVAAVMTWKGNNILDNFCATQIIQPNDSHVFHF